MTKILITGGSGFIGLSLKESLKNLSCEVITIGRSENENIRIDLSSNKLKNILADFKPDVICHFASGSNIARANENKEKEYSDTVFATENLMKSIKEINLKPEKFIYLSSQSVYGVVEDLPISELHSTKPVTVYGENKLKVENILRDSELNYIIFRISSVYGPQQNHLKSGVIAKFVNNLKNNKSPIVFNSIDIFSDFIYIDDVVSAITKAIFEKNIKNEIFNLGLGKPTTLKELLDILYTDFPLAPGPEFQNNSLYPNKEQKGLYLDINKIQKSLNWTNKYTLEKGLKQMLTGLNEKVSLNK